jgi:DNA-binding NtrC family response regulator
MGKPQITLSVVDDDPDDLILFRRLLEDITRWRIELLTFSDAVEALRELDRREFDIIFIDYMLGSETGIDLIKRIRATNYRRPIIMLTGQGNEEVAVEAMRLGVADYLVKESVSPRSLERAILNSLEKYKLQRQVEEQQQQLRQRVRELEEALAHVKQLQGLLPICAYCKRIRDDQNTWRQIEEYIVEHSDAMFSHSICQECMEKYHRDVREDTKPADSVKPPK